jgi:hypothetical protein
MPDAQGPAKGFFGALFDFGFTSFITLRFLSFIYGALVSLIVLGGVVVFGLSITRGGMYVVVALLIVPPVALFQLVLVRISLEAVALFFRIGENTSLIAAAAGAGPTGGGAQPGLPGPYAGPVFPPSRRLPAQRALL